tara:strand:- start:2345 stop:2644 length:300 start_codon:yes stop_codon:yes gene_type:complete
MERTNKALNKDHKDVAIEALKNAAWAYRTGRGETFAIEAKLQAQKDAAHGAGFAREAIVMGHALSCIQYTAMAIEDGDIEYDSAERRFEKMISKIQRIK